MTTLAPELSRPFPLAHLGPTPEHVSITTGAEERRRLADRCGLLGLEALTAEVDLRRGPLGEIEVEGTLTAQVTQECVVTLEPFEARIDDRFALRFAPGPAPTGDVVIEAGADEPPEPLEGDSLDLGEIVAGQLALALDPYPRAPGAELPTAEADAGEAAPTRRPFAGLDRLLAEKGGAGRLGGPNRLARPPDIV